MMFGEYWMCHEKTGCSLCQHWRAVLIAWLKARAAIQIQIDTDAVIAAADTESR